MATRIGAALTMALFCGLYLVSSPAHAADNLDATAVVDKAIKALGGEEALNKVKMVSWKAKGTITFNGNENPVTTQYVMQDLDHFRQELEGEFGGNPFKGVFVVSGDKGIRVFGDNQTDMDKDALANQKRQFYLMVIPTTILPLKDKAFKVEATGDEKVGDKPAAGLKVTGPDGKDFKLYFDKETGLPVKLVAKVVGFMNNEFTQETTFGDYKEMAGIKKATKISSKRDGEKFIDQEITEFKALDKVDPKTFTQP